MTTTAPRDEDDGRVGLPDRAQPRGRLDEALAGPDALPGGAPEHAEVDVLRATPDALTGGAPEHAEVEALRAEVAALRRECDALRARLPQVAADPYPDPSPAAAPALVPIRPPVVVLPAPTQPPAPVDAASVHPPLAPHPRPRRSVGQTSAGDGPEGDPVDAAADRPTGKGTHRHLTAGPVATVVVWVLVALVAVLLLR